MHQRWLSGAQKIWVNLQISKFQANLMIDGWGASHEIALRWMSLDLTNNQSKLFQVMTWLAGNKPLPEPMLTYRRVSNIRCTVVGN